MADTEYTQRYRSFLKARGAATPEQAATLAEVLSGCGPTRNVDFMSWVNGHVAAWKRQNPARPILCNQDEFDAFIASRPHCHRCPSLRSQEA